MAKHRIRRWSQFGILDVLILTSVVAAAIQLCRPLELKLREAAPVLVGGWNVEGRWISLMLLPDGCYRLVLWPKMLCGTGWKVKSLDSARSGFVLECGDQRFSIDRRLGQDAILRSDGTAFTPFWRAQQGQLLDGQPHGVWTFSTDDGTRTSLKYRNGELIDLVFQGTMTGTSERDLYRLNEYRAIRGLPALTERAFPPDGLPAEKRHD